MLGGYRKRGRGIYNPDTSGSKSILPASQTNKEGKDEIK